MQEIAAFETPLYRPYEYWAYWGDAQLHHNQAIPGWISHPLVTFYRELWEASGGYPHITLNEDSGLFRKMHEFLGSDWLTYPIERADRYMIMRCASLYSHTSIAGGKRPPNTSPGTIEISPRPIQDRLLRHAAEGIIEQHSSASKTSSFKPSPAQEMLGKGWLESVRTRPHLDDRPIESQSVGFGALGRHGRLGYDGKQVIVGGKHVRHALSAHAPSDVKFRVDEGYDGFDTYVAINDDAIGKATSADFFVLVDGEIKGCATNVIPGDPPRRIFVDVEKGQTLELRTQTRRWSHCHSVWLEPTYCCSKPNAQQQRTFIDCLRRAEVSQPEVPEQEVDLCISTVVSPGYEGWLQTFLESLRVNGACKDALIAVVCFGTNSKIDLLIQQYGAIKVSCKSLVNVNMTSKSVLYSMGKIVPAKKYLCFDTDMVVLGSLREVVASLDLFCKSSVLICRDAANISKLGHALTGLYGSDRDSLKSLAGPSAVRCLDFPLVVNDGFFLASRPALNSVDELIRSFPGAVDWIEEKSQAIPWRNQFVFNLALAKLGTAVEIDQSMNWQLNHRSLELDGETGTVRTTSMGTPLKVIHFNGGGRNRYPILREQFHRDSHLESPSQACMATSTVRRAQSKNAECREPRFVICSSLRTGSHMLATAFDQHPKLKVAGEILVRPKLFGLGENKNSPEGELLVINESFQKFNGCIIHRQHLGAIQHLGEMPDLKIIFLRRRNWLAQLVSEIRAHQTNVWHVAPEGVNYLSNDGSSKPEQSPPQLTISVKRCIQFLQDQNRLDLLALKHLSGCARLTVAYEDLQWNWKEAIQEALQFLEIDEVPLAPVTLKQGFPAYQSVANYDEIAHFFSNTRWDVRPVDQMSKWAREPLKTVQ
ncbi:Stf0 family sulfotransferase [Thalassoglobus neptunius]|nr:Stf0 family sulfotransferase [Thalassoglobus neptunius]